MKKSITIVGMLLLAACTSAPDAVEMAEREVYCEKAKAGILYFARVDAPKSQEDFDLLWKKHATGFYTKEMHKLMYQIRERQDAWASIPLGKPIFGVENREDKEVAAWKIIKPMCMQFSKFRVSAKD